MVSRRAVWLGLRVCKASDQTQGLSGVSRDDDNRRLVTFGALLAASRSGAACETPPTRAPAARHASASPGWAPCRPPKQPRGGQSSTADGATPSRACKRSSSPHSSWSRCHGERVLLAIAGVDMAATLCCRAMCSGNVIAGAQLCASSWLHTRPRSYICACRSRLGSIGCSCKLLISCVTPAVSTEVLGPDCACKASLSEPCGAG